MKFKLMSRHSPSGLFQMGGALMVALWWVSAPLCPSATAQDANAAEIKQLKADLAADAARLERLEKGLGVAPAQSSAAGSKPADAAHAAPTPDSSPTPEGSVKAEKAKDDDFFEVPDSPTAAILGVTPQKIVRPSNPKKLIGSILDGIDEHGNFQTGAAIDVTPYKFWHTKKEEIKDDDSDQEAVGRDTGLRITLWNPDYYRRVAQRTQFSLVAVKGTTDTDKSVKLALGVQITLMDETDPYLKIGDLYDQAVKTRRLQLGRQYKDVPAARKKSWHYNSSWNVGEAQAFMSQDGGSSNFRTEGYAVYSTYAYGFEGTDQLNENATYLQKHDQLLFQIQYRDHDRVPDAKNKGAFLDEDRVKLALRFRFGDQDFNASFVGSFMEEKIPGGSYEPAYSVAFDVEKLLFGNTYLTVSLGKEFDHPDGNNPVLAIGGVKFGVSPPASGRSNPD